MPNTIIGIVLLVSAVFLVISILFQSSKSHRMPGAIAGGAETFFGKTKGKTIDKMLGKLTAIVAVIFCVLVVVMYVAQPKPGTNTGNTDSGTTTEDAAGTDTTDATDSTDTTDGTDTTDTTGEDAGE